MRSGEPGVIQRVACGPRQSPPPPRRWANHAVLAPSKAPRLRLAPKRPRLYALRGYGTGAGAASAWAMPTGSMVRGHLFGGRGAMDTLPAPRTPHPYLSPLPRAAARVLRLRARCGPCGASWRVFPSMCSACAVRLPCCGSLAVVSCSALAWARDRQLAAGAVCSHTVCVLLYSVV
jgi:hypothetical protein